MSTFTGGASGGTAGVGDFRADDIRLWPRWVTDPWAQDPSYSLPMRVGTEGFATPWWPGRGSCCPGIGYEEWHAALWGELPEVTRGHSGRLGFAGVTRDVYGTAVPGAVVKLFRTADDSLQYSGTSGSDGFYTATTPFSDAHYLVAYKDDVIDTAGATVNTLIPA